MLEPNWALACKLPRLSERARILQKIRAFFVAAGFLEVETPQRIPANAPEPHIDAVASGDWALQTSPELAMKRLLAAGSPDLFQLCRVWREGERGARHLPEFTLLEWYRRAADYTVLMTDCQALLRSLCPTGRIDWQGESIDLAGPWQTITVADAFVRHAGLSVEQALASGRFEEILTGEVEPCLGDGRPTFLIDYPVELGALARSSPDNPAVAERFELYIAGLELANGFSELTDPVEQRRRFARDEQARRAAGRHPWPLPEPFLAELATIPDAAGIALGIDRLVMLLCNACCIDDIVAFPPELL
ncbi:MAG: EF-P lysine aminoacylase EpmA [Desulfuromonadales bacterium]|nr:EF-P lysine aminoacylase EpmA [Desulfuromonadales bacterium]